MFSPTERKAITAVIDSEKVHKIRSQETRALRGYDALPGELVICVVIAQSNSHRHTA